ncbi:helix-turn-helix domain-containing protein [Halothiobacillus sp.]|uniref:helix-turn-helix domain-containing protein n=1 Tax=Halothiobacillus sp. TaxID=1891311 RepID=UPI003452A7D9
MVSYFVERFNDENNRRLTFNPDAMQTMLSCFWPGNVRELENCIERTCTMLRGDVIRQTDIPCQRNQCLSMSLRPAAGGHPIVTLSVPSRSVASSAASEGVDGGEQITEVVPLTERDRLIQAMERCGWVQAKAARLLNTTTRKLGYALLKYGIEVKRL